MSLFHFIFYVCTVTLEQLRKEYSDEDLITLISGQEEKAKEAFEVLVERHQVWMVKFLTHMISDQQDAEDLAQNVFVRAFFALPKFRQDASFRTWIRTIASREAFNFYRKRGERPIDPENFSFMEGTKGDQERIEQHEALHTALASVPYPYREILVLRYVEEMNLEEIGAMLELGTSATKMRIKRAREFFKTSWTQHT